MADQSDTCPEHIHFGTFLVDPHTRQLFRNGIPVRVQDQPYDLLLLLLEKRGDIVSRDDIQKKLWPKGTFVDFEQSINKSVAKLRDALGDSADNPRFVETVARRGYRFIAPNSCPFESRVERPKRFWIYAFATAACVAAIAGVALTRLDRRHPPPAEMRQLTYDSGITFEPALSPDGRLVAYASNRTGKSGFDVYIQQADAEAQAIRLTADAADDVDPSFSPDGKQIVFWSARNGGGLYVVPAFGGEQRLIMKGLFANARYSPDGSRIVANTTASYASALWVIPTVGGDAARVTDDFYAASNPLWSPDGRRILFRGQKHSGSPWDWWIVDANGGAPVSAGASALLRSDQPISSSVIDVFRSGIPTPSDWLRDEIFFSDGHLMRIRVGPNGTIAGPPDQITSGSGTEAAPRAVLVNGRKLRIAFASIATHRQVWTLPMDHDSGAITGVAQPLMTDTVERWAPSTCRDGSKVAYVAYVNGEACIRIQDLNTREERTLMKLKGDARAPLAGRNVGCV